MKIKYNCICLERKINERFSRIFSESFKKHDIDINIIKAIDGESFKSSLEISKKYKLTLGTKMKKCCKTLIAIAQSHRKTWKEISMDNDSDFNIVFEDDILIKCSNFKKEIEIILSNFKNFYGPKILLLGCLFSNKINKYNQTYSSNLISQINSFAGLQCYVLDKSSAKFLLDNSNILVDQIDNVISNHIFINKYTLNNQIIYHKNIPSLTHSQRNIFLELNGFDFLSYKIGINFNIKYSFINTSISYQISFTLNTIFNIFIGYLLRQFVDFYILFFIFFIYEVFVFGGVIFWNNFNGLNAFSRYDDDEVVNKLIDFILFSIVILIK